MYPSSVYRLGGENPSGEESLPRNVASFTTVRLIVALLQVATK